MPATKDCRGNWSVSEDIPLLDDRALRISTHKTSNGSLVTSATVGIVGPGTFSFVMFQDFSKRVLVTRHPRITGKIVDAQQAQAKQGIDTLMKEIAAHYPEILFPTNVTA